MQTPRKHRGVTLIEASLVSAIVAVSAALAAPNLQGLLDLRRLDAAAGQLAADLQLARSEAVARNQPVRLSWNAAAGCYLVHTGASGQCQCSDGAAPVCTGSAEAIRSVAWNAQDRLLLQSNTSSIVFDPQHGTATPSATLRITGVDGRAIHHVVNVMGRVRTCSPLAAVPGLRAC